MNIRLFSKHMNERENELVLLLGVVKIVKVSRKGQKNDSVSERWSIEKTG